MKNSNLHIIRIFALLLLFASAHKLSGLINYPYYKFMFQYLPDSRILMRYFVSIFIRVAGLFVGVGLFYRNNFCRKAFILLCLISLASLPFKHSFAVFKNIAIYEEYKGGINQLPAGTKIENLAYPLFPKEIKNYRLKYPQFPWISMIFFMSIDIIFAVAAAYYFTRPTVKEIFQTK